MATNDLNKIASERARSLLKERMHDALDSVALKKISRPAEIHVETFKNINPDLENVLHLVLGQDWQSTSLYKVGHGDVYAGVCNNHQLEVKFSEDNKIVSVAAAIQKRNGIMVYKELSDLYEKDGILKKNLSVREMSLSEANNREKFDKVRKSAINAGLAYMRLKDLSKSTSHAY